MSLGWKSLYYGPVMGVLGRLDAARADGVNSWLARWCGALSGEWLTIKAAASAAIAILGEFAPPQAKMERMLLVSAARHRARDFLVRPTELAAQFEVSGAERVLNGSKGAILLGCHYGAYVPALHWLFRNEPRLRCLVQRPTHVSAFLQTRFDDASGSLSQARLFVKRGLPAAEAAERIVRAKVALSSGLKLYTCGDIPWPKGRAARFLGRLGCYQTIWVELALAARVPVIPVFATFEGGGRFAIDFGDPISVCANDPGASVGEFFERLQKRVSDRPEQAWAYWAWRSYQDAMRGGNAILSRDDDRRVRALQRGSTRPRNATV